jgi:hypothetical protein
MLKTCVLVMLSVAMGISLAANFQWQAQKMTVESKIPGNWRASEQAQQYGETLMLRPNEGYATISVTAFNQLASTKGALSTLGDVVEWAKSIETTEKDKLEKQSPLSAEVLKRSGASEGLELDYTWTNDAGITGRSIQRILKINGRFYEFRLLCSDMVWQSESRNLSKFLDSIRLK